MSKDIKPRNDKSQPHGVWELYFTNGKLMSKKYYLNGNLVGYAEWYCANSGEIRNKQFFLR